MSPRPSYERMSGHDAGYLARETATQPLHYVVQLDLDGSPTCADVRAQVATHLPRLPLAHRRPRWPLLAGRPVWVDDPEFDVRRQVVPWGSPLPDQAAVDAAFAQLSRQILPRDRPLWQLFVGHRSDGRTVLWLAVHHAMMDGGLLRTMLTELFPAVLGQREQVAPWTAVRGPSRLRLLLLVLLRRVVRRRFEAAPAAPQVRQTIPTTLTGPVSPSRALADVTVPLTPVRAAGRAAGLTLNDLFLVVVTDALRSWLPERPATVLALVPRNVRASSEAQVIGNRGASLLVPLPTGEADREARVRAICTRTAEGKSAAGTEGTQGWRFDLALSNVPLGGPFAVDGAPVTGIRTAVPLQGTNRLVGVLTTHDDLLTVSWTADGQAHPDVAQLAALTGQALERAVHAVSESVA